VRSCLGIDAVSGLPSLQCRSTNEAFSRPSDLCLILLAFQLVLAVARPCDGNTCAATATPVQPRDTRSADATSVPSRSASRRAIWSKSLSLDDLKKLRWRGEAGFKSSTGKITPPVLHRGVSLQTFAELLGPLDPDMGVNAVARDGYAITFSYDQLTKGTSRVRPSTGEELKSPGA